MPPLDNSHDDADDLADQEPLLQNKCDYLVVGAGTSGMGFIDMVLTKKPKATIVLVDRNDGPGGQWQHVYSFCKLHQTSCNYGVDSLQLGKSIDRKGNERYDTEDRATGAEVVEYFEKACHKFQQTGRFKSFFGFEYDSFDEKQGVHLIRPKDGTENSFTVTCRKLVMITNNVVVPSMREPIIPVHEDAHFVPVNDLPSSIQSGNYNKYIVFGCGKTGADAVVNLLQNGVDQSQIAWIVSRDVWYFARDGMANFWRFNELFMKSMAKSKSVKDIFLRWEKYGFMGRLANKEAEKTGSIPQVIKGAIIDLEELELMRSVQNVVRMGRATSVEQNRIILNQGTLDYSSEDTLLVDCMVDNFYGYDFDKDFNIFEPGKINLGPLTFLFNASASAAHIAVLECALEDDKSKNEKCFFLRRQAKELSNIENIVGAIYMQNKVNEELVKIPGGSKFLTKSRVNIIANSHHKGGMFRFMWFLYGPERGVSHTKKVTKKVESKAFIDIDHCFGIEMMGNKKNKKNKSNKKI